MGLSTSRTQGFNGQMLKRMLFAVIVILLFLLNNQAQSQSFWLRVDGMNQGINSGSNFRALAGISFFAFGKEMGGSTSTGWLVGLSTVANSSPNDAFSMFTDLLYDTGAGKLDLGLGGVAYLGPIGLSAAGHMYFDPSELEDATNAEDVASFGFTAGLVFSLDKTFSYLNKRTNQSRQISRSLQEDIEYEGATSPSESEWDSSDSSPPSPSEAENSSGNQDQEPDTTDSSDTEDEPPGR
ncbi:MAG: hypothetical protein GXO35_03935 [Gammaproteobacteria bacterium]|nr:hypothetical protein [Gammaproteobacteria bacterium]